VSDTGGPLGLRGARGLRRSIARTDESGKSGVIDEARSFFKGTLTAVTRPIFYAPPWCAAPKKKHIPLRRL
jgi:hypothetical protein